MRIKIAKFITCLLVSGSLIESAQAAPVKYGWLENAGWIDYAPQYDGTSYGVTVYPDHLEGFAWGENIGWISLGSHASGGIYSYANSSGTDWGVNHNIITNALSGFAWSETSGWIDFSPQYGGVFYIAATGQLDGWAWSENIGWIRFYNQPSTLMITIDGSGTVTSQSQIGINYSCSGQNKTCSPVIFGYGDTVTLSATGSNSGFKTWSGDLTGSSTPGIIAMDGDKAVTATFNADSAKVRVDGDLTPYYSIGTALVIPGAAATIRAQATDFVEAITMTNPVAILLRGGYSDADFTSQTSYTTISGSLRIGSGTLRVDQIKIKP